MNDNEELTAENTASSPAPKRRGRPPRKPVRESPDEIVSPDVVTLEPKEVGPKKRRPKSKNEELDTAALAKKLQGWHQLAAMLLRTPELVLEDDEAEMLVNDVAALTREYGISLTGKTAAWLGLAGSLAMIYAPRALIVAQKIQAAKAARRIPQPPPGVVNG